jgi:hypothetical protein
MRLNLALVILEYYSQYVQLLEMAAISALGEMAARCGRDTVGGLGLDRA